MARDSVRFVSLFLPAAESAREVAWRPLVDVYRTPDGWLVKFDLAGVRPEDVQLSVSGSTLAVRGCRRDGCLEAGCSHYQMEISYSHFERRLQLPESLEKAVIDTEHRDGMLLVRIRRGDRK